MKKVHLCCGSVYLKGYENCDIDGDVLENFYVADQLIENPNETTLDNYFKDPFEPDSDKRVRKQFIIDTKMKILEKWPWEDGTVDEVVMINGWEHFWHTTELPFIRDEVKRVLKPGGKYIVNFPNVKEIVDKYYESDPFKCMELLYCNHKNMYSIHHFGYTPKTFKTWWPDSYEIEEKTVVKCDHPMIGMVVTKK